MSLFTRIPKPMKGMNWEPSPSDYTSLPAPEKYGDTDFANDDFVALWNQDSSGVGRHDLKTLQDMGVNTIKMYNWSVPAPNGYWMRDHKNFLAKCQQLGLKVIVPISNFFTGTAYANRTGSNPGGPGPSTDLKTWIEQIVTEIYTDGDPGPAVMWAIGNEYDNSNAGAYGYCEAQDIATIAKYIVDAENKLTISSGNGLAMSSPVTTAVQPINSGIQCVSTAAMAVCAITDLQKAFVTALGETEAKARFMASINSYQIGQQLVDYYDNYASYFPSTWVAPFYYGELGFSAAQSGAATQAKNVYNQFTTIIPQAGSGNDFYGACAFEFSDELWKGPSGSTETTFGVYTFDSGSTPQQSTETSTAHPPNAAYPVDKFIARAAAGCLKAALTGTVAPGGCS